MYTLATLIDRHGIDVSEHLDREATVPVHTGLQRQGDVIVVPIAAGSAAAVVPSDGVTIVEAGFGRNAHVLLAEGHVAFDRAKASDPEQLVGVLTVPKGATAWLAHPEHAYTGIGLGTYEIRRQREQWDEPWLVED